MHRIIIALFLTLLCLPSSNAQESINNFKYLIVPVRYEFQKSDDQHQVNSLIKFLFEKTDFEVYLSNEEFPDELKLNRCLALTARLNDNSKLFSTNMNFDLIDCSNKVFYSTKEAKSKEKDYKTAYHNCIRETFEELLELDYSYEPQAELVAVNSVKTPESTKSETLPEVKKETVSSNNNVSIPVAATAVVTKEKVEKEPEVISTTNTVTVSDSPKPEITETKSVSNSPSEVVENNEKKVAIITDSVVLYAQPNENGFQIVDSTPKIVYVLLKTKVKDVYLVKDQSATVYKEDGVWKLEYYKNGKSVVKELNIKFF